MTPFNDRYPKGTHLADVLADEAINYLKQQSADTPFFMHLAYFLIHTPLQAVPDFVGNYDKAIVKPVYASMIEKMDQSIGRVLAALDEQGLSENTLVVFSSDNGGIAKESSQAPYRAGKGSYFEGGVRVPLVVRWPGVVAPAQNSTIPVTGLDFYPTFLAAANLDAPAE